MRQEEAGSLPAPPQFGRRKGKRLELSCGSRTGAIAWGENRLQLLPHVLSHIPPAPRPALPHALAQMRALEQAGEPGVSVFRERGAGWGQTLGPAGTREAADSCGPRGAPSLDPASSGTGTLRWKRKERRMGGGRVRRLGCAEERGGVRSEPSC